MSVDATDTFSFLAAAVEASPGAIVAADLDGKIIHWNSAAARLLGFSPDRAVGLTLMSLVPEDARESATKILDRVRGGETIENREVERLRKDGSSLIVNLTVVPIRSADGSICGTVGFMNDVTERKLFEELLRRNERLASVGTLAAGIAHEINNPVGGILMAAQYASTALQRGDAAAVVGKALADIEEDARRCRDIVRRVRRLAYEEGPALVDADVNSLIEATLRLAGGNLDDDRVELCFSPDRELPRVPLNRADIEQVLMSLLDNAVEAGSRRIDVEALVDRDENRLRITVRDDGRGIENDLLHHLFDPFFTTRRQSGGSGLGLSLAHAIITNHHGTLDVASTENEGTTATIELPLTTTSPSE